MDLAQNWQKITRWIRWLSVPRPSWKWQPSTARGRCTGKRRSARSKQEEADLILIGLDDRTPCRCSTSTRSSRYALKGSDVETVVIGGRVVCATRGPERDEAAVIAQAREYKSKIEASLK